jgi:aspartyl protease family protein
MIRLVMVIAFIGLVVGALMPTGQSRSPAATAAPSAPTLIAEPKPRQAAAAAVSGPWTTLVRQANGHFYARALVNGQSIDFIVDTGATAVALTEADARRVGIAVDPANYAVIGSGASGAVRGQPVVLDSVSLDGKRVEQVEGAVLEGSEISLLGQSFLARMGNIEIAGERMIIR